MYTPWFFLERDSPARKGWYEACDAPGAATVRIYWDGKSWMARERIADDILLSRWRGLLAQSSYPEGRDDPEFTLGGTARPDLSPAASIGRRFWHR